jgi:hypothetical protein
MRRPYHGAHSDVLCPPELQGRWYTAVIRPLLAMPIVIYFWKVIVWDKVLGWGVTDPITGMIADWAGVIITAYVGGRSIEKVARIFNR